MAKKINAVVFDMDGVIFDTEQAYLNCWEMVADKYKLEEIKEACIACVGTTMEKTKEIMMERYGEAFPYDQYSQEAGLLFCEKYGKGNLPVRKGTRELLEWLKEQKVKVGLASSTKKETVLRELKEAGLDAYFQVILGGDLVKEGKPHPEIYEKACQMLGVKPEEAYAIEDSFHGIRAAYSAGMQAIMVPDLVRPDEEMKEKTICIQEDLLEVLRYFSTL